MPKVATDVVVPAEPSRVWGHLSDYTNAPSWNKALTGVRRVEGDGDVGSRYRAVARLVRPELDAAWTVCDLEPGSRLRLVGNVGRLEVLETFDVAEHRDGTRIDWVLQWTAAGPPGVLSPLLRRTMRTVQADGSTRLGRIFAIA